MRERGKDSRRVWILFASSSDFFSPEFLAVSEENLDRKSGARLLTLLGAGPRVGEHWGGW